MPGESSTSPRRIGARERQLQALELRKAGGTYEAIAKQLGYAGRQGAAMAIEAALKRVFVQPAESIVKLDIERLDMMLLALMPNIRHGSAPAVRAALKVMERRAKLLGLDAPIKIEAEVEHVDKRDLSKVPKGDIDRLLADVESILHGNGS